MIGVSCGDNVIKLACTNGNDSMLCCKGTFIDKN